MKNFFDLRDDFYFEIFTIKIKKSFNFTKKKKNLLKAFKFLITNRPGKKVNF